MWLICHIVGELSPVKSYSKFTLPCRKGVLHVDKDYNILGSSRGLLKRCKYIVYYKTIC